MLFNKLYLLKKGNSTVTAKKTRNLFVLKIYELPFVILFYRKEKKNLLNINDITDIFKKYLLLVKF